MNQYTKAYGKILKSKKPAKSSDARIIKGIATTQTLDRDGDIVSPAEQSLPYPSPFYGNTNATNPSAK